MKYQLVLQWDASSLADCDRLIEIENALIQGFGSAHDVDGHDEGSGQMNIFIHTDDPAGAFKMSKSILSKNDIWREVRIACREVSGKNYTILWPKGLREFKVL